MNKSYRLLWNELTQTWVAVAEIARGRGKRTAAAVLLVASGLALAAPPGANQLPTGGQIVGGSAAGVIASNGSAMTVTQNTQRMIANWNSFNIGANASVNFVQPSASAIALNRVLGQDPTQILGSLSANGQVMLVNPAGIVFGQGSQVNVGALVASSLALSDANFMAGNYSFAHGLDGLAGSVVNQGRITTPAGGVVALIAPVVKNSGQIETPQGSTLLVAADQVTLDFVGDGLITYSMAAGAANALVDNSGSISADGGIAVLSARSADAVTRSVVNNSGVVRASSLSAKGGRIVLEGDAVTLTSSSTLEATGASGGGTVLVGGDWQGSGTMRQATSVSMEAGARIDASATQSGDGGKVVLWSDTGKVESVTTVKGEILANGGVAGGNGGNIETSGYAVDVGGASVSAAAPAGTGGTWLIDPTDSTINQTIANSYAATLNGGTSVENTAADITVSSGVSIAKTGGGDATLTLKAQSTIIFGTGTSISSSSNRLNVILWADSNNDNNGGVRLEGATNSRVAISTNGGGIWIGGSNSTASWTPYTGATVLTVGDGQAKSGGSGFAVNLDYASLNAGVGDINISGRSYATGGGYGIGVRMNGAASVIGNNITISGTGSTNGSGKNNNWGVSLEGGSSISGSGAVSVTGTGGGASPGNNYGVYVAGSASAISATGTGTVSVTGTAGADGSGNQSNNNHGIYITGGAKISAVDGNVSVTGTGGAIATGYNHYGVYLDEDNSSITTSGSGNIIVSGTAGTGGNNASNSGYGVYLNDSTTPNIAAYPSIIATGSGNVTITGTATGKSGGTEVGIALNAGKVSSTSGTLSLTGTGGSGSANSTGVTLASASISSTTGDITISGTAGNSTATTNHLGINLASGITSSSGNISLTTADYVQGDVDIVAGSGAITISADTVALGTNTGNNPLQTTGAITLKPKTDTTSMSLAGVSTFDLSTAEIAYLKGSTSPSIMIGGNSSTGVMTIGSAVDLAGKAFYLKAGSFTDAATSSNIITAASVNLAANSGGDIGGSATNAALDLAAATVSATTTGSGSAYLKSSTGFALAQSTVGGTLSLTTSGGGNVTQSGKLTVGTLTAALAGSTAKLNLGTYANAISSIGDVLAKGGVSLNNGNNSITVAGNISSDGGTSTSAIDISVGTGTYTQNTNKQVTTGLSMAGITITADNMVLGSNVTRDSIFTRGALTLQPATITRGITLGGSTETPGQLVLQTSEFDAFNQNSALLFTIGGNTSGTMTIGGTFGFHSGGVLLLKAGSIKDVGTNTISMGNNIAMPLGTLWLSAINNDANIGSATDSIDFYGANLRAYTVGTGSAYIASPMSYTMKASSVGGTLGLGLTGTGHSISQDSNISTGPITAGALKLSASGLNVT